MVFHYSIHEKKDGCIPFLHKYSNLKYFLALPLEAVQQTVQQLKPTSSLDACIVKIRDVWAYKCMHELYNLIMGGRQTMTCKVITNTAVCMLLKHMQQVSNITVNCLCMQLHTHY